MSRSRELLSGKRVSSDTDELLMTEAGLGRATGAHIPIYIAATGRKTLALAGEVAEGVIAHVGASPATLQHARQSAAPALRKDFDFNPYLYLCLAETRELGQSECAKGAKTIALRAPHLARIAGCSADAEKQLQRPDRDVDDLITPNLVSELTLCGPVPEVIDRLEDISALGIEHVTVFPRGDDIAATITRFGQEILPRFS